MEVPTKKENVINPQFVKKQQNGINQQPPKMKTSVKMYIIFGVGLILIIGGITVGILWNTIVDHIRESELVLSPSSMSFKMWDTNPIPVYLSFYMFSLNNSAEFLKGEKPSFIQKGPYVFRERYFKTDKVWNSNGTVTFHRNRNWTFVPELSETGASLSDNITNLNPIALTMGHILRFQKPLVKLFANILLKKIKEGILLTKTVGELLFDGYEDKLLYIARKLNITNLPYDKFGWFHGRNNSDVYEGTYSIKTGENSFSEIGELVEYNYSNKTIYDNGKCDKVKGTLGDLWHPFTSTEKSKLSVFSSDFCTSVELVYGNETEFLGVKGTKFITDKNTLDNGESDPTRKCYCDNVECQPTGALNVSLCKFGAPAFISLPHFYLADASYRKNIIGMTPSRDLHESYLILDPIMGVPIEIKAQFQLNMLVRHDPKLDMFKNINDTFIPMLWFRQTAELNSKYATLVKIVHMLPLIGHVTFFGIGGIGALIVFIVMFITLRAKWREEENQNLLPNEIDNNSVITNEG